MSEQTALKAMEALDRDKWAVNITVQQVLSILRDYIPDACIRDAEDALFKAFFVNEVELTNADMRREYEAWKKIELNNFMRSPIVFKP